MPRANAGRAELQWMGNVSWRRAMEWEGRKRGAGEVVWESENVNLSPPYIPIAGTAFGLDCCLFERACCLASSFEVSA